MAKHDSYFTRATEYIEIHDGTLRSAVEELFTAEVKRKYEVVNVTPILDEMRKKWIVTLKRRVAP